VLILTNEVPRRVARTGVDDHDLARAHILGADPVQQRANPFSLFRHGTTIATRSAIGPASPEATGGSPRPRMGG
jgi:hypothetical protein